jgi:hypothetical protein
MLSNRVKGEIQMMVVVKVVIRRTVTAPSERKRKRGG